MMSLAWVHLQALYSQLSMLMCTGRTQLQEYKLALAGALFRRIKKSVLLLSGPVISMSILEVYQQCLV
jgi:hypothetical protein